MHARRLAQCLPALSGRLRASAERRLVSRPRAVHRSPDVGPALAAQARRPASTERRASGGAFEETLWQQVDRGEPALGVSAGGGTGGGCWIGGEGCAGCGEGGGGDGGGVGGGGGGGGLGAGVGGSGSLRVVMSLQCFIPSL